MFAGDANWRAVKVATDRTFKWNMTSTYVQNPPYFDGIEMKPEPIRDIVDARILCLFLNSITTDLFLRPVPSRRHFQPALICRNIKSDPRISISTEPAAATTKS